MAERKVALKGRDMLDEPPPRGRLRSLAGPGERTPITPPAAGSDLVNSPDGEMNELDPNATSELDGHPIVQGFKHLEQAIGHLEIFGSFMPNTMAAVQDLVNTLKQLAPQEAASMLSGNSAGAMGAGAGTPMPMQPGGGLPTGGLNQLAGVGVGGPQSMPMAPPEMMM